MAEFYNTVVDYINLYRDFQIWQGDRSGYVRGESPEFLPSSNVLILIPKRILILPVSFLDIFRGEDASEYVDIKTVPMRLAYIQ